MKKLKHLIDGLLVVGRIQKAVDLGWGRLEAAAELADAGGRRPFEGGSVDGAIRWLIETLGSRGCIGKSTALGFADFFLAHPTLRLYIRRAVES